MVIGVFGIFIVFGALIAILIIVKRIGADSVHNANSGVKDE